MMRLGPPGIAFYLSRLPVLAQFLFSVLSFALPYVIFRSPKLPEFIAEMIRGRPCKYYLSVNFRNLVTTCTVPLDPPVTSSSSSASEHKTLCYSLVEQLIRRGLFLPAQQVIQRIVTQSSSISEAISIVDFAAERGLELDLDTHGVFCRQLVYSRPQLAELLYDKKFTFGGAEPDASVLDSMYCQEGKVDFALTILNSMVSCNFSPSLHCYTVLINALHRDDRLEEVSELLRSDVNSAIGLFNKMNVDGCIPDEVAYNTLLKGLSQGGRLSDALALHMFICSCLTLARSLSATLSHGNLGICNRKNVENLFSKWSEWDLCLATITALQMKFLTVKGDTSIELLVTR
ncbi:Pentatricopeptide repeat-containing protein, partial [Cucurbita argyrosperma subsp. argyrosperma]